MKYKEFKNTIKYWGEVYGYKTELKIESDCIWVELEGKNCKCSAYGHRCGYISWE